MTLRLITADERLNERNLKVTMAIFGEWGVGKTSLLKTLDPETTLFMNLEAGEKSVQTTLAHEFPIREYKDALDLAVLIGGPNYAMPNIQDVRNFSLGHYKFACSEYAALPPIDKYKTIFVDSVTDLSRLAMTWSQQQPEAFSEKTGKSDVRGAYGLLGRELMNFMKHLQHAPGRNVIFVGILECFTDEFGRKTWEPQMEGSKIGRELPGIVDQVVTMGFFDYDETGTNDETRWRYAPGEGKHRGLVCQRPNPWKLPAKDRSGNLNLIEEPHLGRLIDKINAPARVAASRLEFPDQSLLAAV